MQKEYEEEDSVQLTKLERAAILSVETLDPSTGAFTVLKRLSPQREQRRRREHVGAQSAQHLHRVRVDWIPPIAGTRRRVAVDDKDDAIVVARDFVQHLEQVGEVRALLLDGRFRRRDMEQQTPAAIDLDGQR